MRKLKNFNLSYLIIIVISLLIYLVFTNNSVNAYNIFKSNNYNIPSGMDMLLWPRRTACSNIIWKSENDNIATVNSYGIVHGKSVGSTKILAYNPFSDYTSVCTVDITQPNPVRSTYISPGLPVDNDNITLYSLTPKNSESVKFIITSHNYRNEVYAQKYYENEELYFWKANLSPLKYNNYRVETFSKINGKFESTNSANIEFKVSNYENKSTISTQRRELSKEGVEFILKQEGFVSNVYKDIANFLAIGYGKSVYPYEKFYNKLNKEEAYQDFLNKVKSSKYESAVNDLLVNNGIKFNQHQFDALVSFTYNIGRGWTTHSYLRTLILNSGNQINSDYAVVNSTDGLFLRENASTKSRKLASLYYGDKVTILNYSKKNYHWYNVRTQRGQTGYCYGDYLTLLNHNSNIKSLNNIDREEFINEFLFYHHSGRKCIKGLLYRRIKELEIFLNGNYNSRVKLDAYPIPFCIKKLL